MDISEFFTPGWITLGISLIGFISFYLGKIVLDFYPTQEDKPLNYIVGFILFLTYILIPSLLFYYFPNLILNLNLGLFILFWIIYCLFAKYFRIKMNVFQVLRGNAGKYFYEVSSKNISKFGFNMENMPKLKKIFKNLFMKLPSQLKVIIFGYIIIFLIVNMIFYFNNLIIPILIFIIAISTFNNIIILHNAKKIVYEEVIIEDINNKKFKGKLIKQDANYIVLDNEKNLYKFPKENIKNIHKIKKIDLRVTEQKINKVAKIWNKLDKKRDSKKYNGDNN